MEPVDWRTSYRPFLMQEQVQSPCARSLCASDYDPIIEVEETSITDTAVFKIGMTILGAAAYYCASELLLESMIQSVVLLTSGTWGAYWALRSINHFVPEVGIMLYLVAERVYRAIEFIIIKSAQACWLSLTYTAMSVAYVANVIDETANAISSHCDRALNAAISYSYPIISDAVEYIYTKVAACASWVVGALEDAFEWIVWNCSNQRSSWAETIKNELSAFAAVQVLSDLYCSNDEWMRLKPARQQEVFHYMNATYGDEQADIRSFSQKAFPVLQSMHRIKRAMVDHDTSFDVALIDLCMGRDDLFTMAFEAIQLHYSSGEAFQAFKQFYEKFKMVENAIATNDPLTCIDNIWGFSEPVAKALFGRACMRIAAAPAPETGYETSWIKPMADAILPRMIVRDELELAIRKKSTPEAVLITHAATTKKEDWIDFLDSIQRRITFENSRAAHTETERVRNWMRGVDSLKVALKNKKVADCRKHLEKANHFATAFLEKAYPELTYEELLLVSVIAYQTLQKAMNTPPPAHGDVIVHEAQQCDVQQQWIERLRNGKLAQAKETDLRQACKKIQPHFTATEREDCDAVFILMKYDLNLEHLNKGTAAVSIPSKKPETDLNTLLTFFDNINFTRPNEPNYYNAAILFKDDYYTTGNHGTEEIRQSLRNQLLVFIDRVKNKIAYAATPSAFSWGLYEFYNTIENGLGNVIEKMNTIEDPDEKQVVIADTLIHVLRAASHCGPRIYEMAVKRYLTRCLSKKESDADAIYDLAAEFRGILIESRLPPQGSGESIMYYSHVVRELGEELGLPGGYVLANNRSSLGAFGSFNKDRDRKRFYTFYNSFTLTSWIVKGMKRDDLITMCGHYIPDSYSPEIIEKANALIQRMRSDNKTNTEIFAELNRQLEIIPGAPTQTPEEAIKAWRQGEYLEKEVAEIDEKGKYGIKPQAILETLVVANLIKRVSTAA